MSNEEQKTAYNIGDIGLGKGWHEHFIALLDIVTAHTDEEFDQREPKFNRAFRKFRLAMKDLAIPQDRLARQEVYRDRELSLAIAHLVGLCNAQYWLKLSERRRQIHDLINTLKEVS